MQGGVKYTIKDGIVYDARKLLRDVRRMVRETKDRERKKIRKPGDLARPLAPVQ